MKKKNTTTYILLACIVLVAGFLFYRHYFNAAIGLKRIQEQNAVKKEESVVFFFEPKDISVAKGEDFIVDILIDPKDHKVSNADLIFSYDKAKIRLDNISQSEKFTQILASKITEDGIAIYSASTNFGVTIDEKTAYAQLHFHALGKVDGSAIEIDQKKSGIYADDNPGVNILGASASALVSVTD